MSQSKVVKTIKLGLLGLVTVAVLGLGSIQQGGTATAAPEADVQIAFAASEGWISLPNRADPLYIFGFVEVPFNASYDELVTYRGQIPLPSPLIDVMEGQTIEIKMTNVGFPTRPDLDDPHTIHWHGFPNPYPIFDGFPESSIAVPVTGEFTYYYVAPGPGTYMWHCHQEPIEHIQMGMVGPLIVRPAGHPDWAYNDPSTAFDREYFFQLGEIDSRPHDLLPAVQEFEWTEYKPDYWTLNGRSYPDTLAENDASSQPYTSLVRANEGDTVLFRFNSLGYEQQTLTAPGLIFKAIGEDAKPFMATGGEDLTYLTSTLYVAPGKSLDVLFTAPDITPNQTDAYGNYYALKLYNRNLYKNTNDGAPGEGGIMTEIRIYPAGTLAPQAGPNQ